MAVIFSKVNILNSKTKYLSFQTILACRVKFIINTKKITCVEAEHFQIICVAEALLFNFKRYKILI